MYCHSDIAYNIILYYVHQLYCQRYHDNKICCKNPHENGDANIAKIHKSLFLKLNIVIYSPICGVKG